MYLDTSQQGTGDTVLCSWFCQVTPWCKVCVWSGEQRPAEASSTGETCRTSFLRRNLWHTRNYSYFKIIGIMSMDSIGKELVTEMI